MLLKSIQFVCGLLVFKQAVEIKVIELSGDLFSPVHEAEDNTASIKYYSNYPLRLYSNIIQIGKEVAAQKHLCGSV